MQLETIAVSHVNLEVPYPAAPNGSSFIPLPIRESPQSERAFQRFLSEVFTGAAYKSIRENISVQYGSGKYSDQIARAAAFITDSIFTCNTRYIIDRYMSDKIRVYAMDYALLAAVNASTHASDLLPAFYNQKADYSTLLKCVAEATSWFKQIAVHIFYDYFRDTFTPAYQRLLTDHAIWGDPNKNRSPLEYSWLTADLRQCPGTRKEVTCVGNLMKPAWHAWPWGPISDNSGSDTQTPASVCGYWADMAQRVSAIYADPPEAAAEQDMRVPQWSADFAEVVFNNDLLSKVSSARPEA
jgi:hypothetical protein